MKSKIEINWTNPKILLPSSENNTPILCYTINKEYYIGYITTDDSIWTSNNKTILVKDVLYWTYFDITLPCHNYKYSRMLSFSEILTWLNTEKLIYNIIYQQSLQVLIHSSFFKISDEENCMGFIGISDYRLTMLGYLSSYEDGIKRLLDEILVKYKKLYIPYDVDAVWELVQKLDFDLIKDTFKNETVFRINYQGDILEVKDEDVEED